MKRLLFALLILAAHFLALQKAAAESGFFPKDKRADALSADVKRLAQFKPGHVSWKPHMGPWRQYIASAQSKTSITSFVDQLSRKERRLYVTAIETGSCALVTALQEAAFLMKFHFLQIAHADSYTSRMFRETIARSSIDYSTCRHFNHLSKVYTFAQKKNLQIKPLDFRNGQTPYKKLPPHSIGDEMSVSINDSARSHVCQMVKGVLNSALGSKSPYALRALIQDRRYCAFFKRTALCYRT